MHLQNRFSEFNRDCPRLLEQDKPNTQRHVAPRLPYQRVPPDAASLPAAAGPADTLQPGARPVFRALCMQKARRR